MIFFTVISACSQSIPYDYTTDDIQQIEHDSFLYFSNSLQDQYDKSDVTVNRICEVDERTLTTNNYNHIFIVQLEDETLNVGLNKNTDTTEMVGDFSNSETCENL